MECLHLALELIEALHKAEALGFFTQAWCWFLSLLG